MKVSTTRLIQIGVIASFLALAGSVAWRSFEPDRIEWLSVSAPVVEDDKLTVTAEVMRRPIEGCTNGPQIDLRRSGEVVRLPVPARTIRGSVSVYEAELPRPLGEGRYSVRLRESVICSGLTQVRESPTVEFWVKE